MDSCFSAAEAENEKMAEAELTINAQARTASSVRLLVLLQVDQTPVLGLLLLQRINRESTQQFGIKIGGFLRQDLDRKSTRLNSSHQIISYAVFCLKKKKLS